MAIEWLKRGKPSVLGMVSELAASVSNPDLQAMCHKLEAIYFGEGGLFSASPAKPRRIAMASARVAIPIAQLETPKPEAEHSAELDQHYVGRLR